MNIKSNNLPHILFVDDDDKIRYLVSEYLNKYGYFISLASNTKEAKELNDFYSFDLIVLDIMMPNENGKVFLKYFRKLNDSTPVLMLTALKTIDSKVETFNLGCDDYLIKPFEPKELIIRINKLLSPRSQQKLNKKVKFGDYEYDFNLQELRKNKKLIKLTNNELRIIDYLSKSLNLTLSREKISQELGMNSSSRSVDVVIARLRKKIVNSDDSSFLKTVRGIGYILKSDYEN